MSRFIKVTEQMCGEVKLLPVSDIIEIIHDKDGSKVVLGHHNFYAKESLEQIEAQLLRDEFAKVAFAGFCSDENMSGIETISLPYEYADAVLKERLK